MSDEKKQFEVGWTCPQCGKQRGENRHDPCIADLPGIKFACCGHGGGVTGGYLYFENGVQIRVTVHRVCYDDGRPSVIMPQSERPELQPCLHCTLFDAMEKWVDFFQDSTDEPVFDHNFLMEQVAHLLVDMVRLSANGDGAEDDRRAILAAVHRLIDTHYEVATKQKLPRQPEQAMN